MFPLQNYSKVQYEARMYHIHGYVWQLEYQNTQENNSAVSYRRCSTKLCQRSNIFQTLSQHGLRERRQYFHRTTLSQLRFYAC